MREWNRRSCSLLVVGLFSALLGQTALAQGVPATPTTQPPTSSNQNPLEWLNENRSERGEERERENERDEIETDRDSFTPATTITGRGRLIFESAYSFLDNRGVKETHSFPETLFRIGVTDWLELRIGANYEVGGAGSEISGSGGEGQFGERRGRESKLERESTLSYGIKARVSKQNGWIPASALIVMARTPSSGEANDTHFINTYVFGWEFANRWKLDAAMRYSTGSEREDRFGVWAPSVVVKVPVMEKVNAHVEYFGLFSSAKAEEFTRHYISPGVHYLLNENVEVGVRLGWGLNDQSVRFFANAGVGVRF